MQKNQSIFIKTHPFKAATHRLQPKYIQKDFARTSDWARRVNGPNVLFFSKDEIIWNQVC